MPDTCPRPVMLLCLAHKTSGNMSQAQVESRLNVSPEGVATSIVLSLAWYSGICKIVTTVVSTVAIAEQFPVPVQLLGIDS